MEFELTGTETADELIKQLVYLRMLARITISHERQRRELRDGWARIRAETHDHFAATRAANEIAEHDEKLLQMKFDLIDFGNYLMPLCDALDREAPKAAVLEALAVNRSEWDSADMLKYGSKTMHIIAVLDLESSATKADGIEIKPLKWCQTMAFMHALQTNEKLDRVVHDGAHEFFNGAFGEYRERPLTERLAGQAV